MKKTYPKNFNFITVGVSRLLFFIFLYVLIYAASGRDAAAIILAGLATWAFSWLVFRRDSRMCDICSCAIPDIGYRGEVSGRKFKNICEPCMGMIAEKTRAGIINGITKRLET